MEEVKAEIDNCDGVDGLPSGTELPDVPVFVDPNDIDVWKLLRFDDEIAAYNFYCNYAKVEGFKVRIRSRITRVGKNRTPNVRHYLKYVCSKKGFNEESAVAPSYISRNPEDHMEASFERKREKTEVRCGCMAFIVLCFREEDKKYEIKDWIGQHNGHEHIPKALSYLQTSNRRVKLEDGLLAELNDRVGVSLDTSYRLMCRGVGGPQNLGCLKVDLKNHLQTRRKSWMAPSEGVCIQQHLKNTALRNPGFYCDIQYDADDLITNIFWADQQMIMDYSLFGDTVAFDTTYRTNKAYRPLGLFAGFNHHRQIIVFGAALLFYEMIPSFQWLFPTFSTCMGSALPMSIFTDQDAAMAHALRTTLPSVSHFLCTWHILQNVKHNVNTTIQANVTHTLTHLMYHVENVEEFNYVWNDMMERHFSSTTNNSGSHKSKSWLLHLVEKREQWSNCWVNKTFTAGMRTTQASESINGTVRCFLRSDHRIMDFFPHFEEMIETIQHRENIKEFESRDKVVTNRFRGCPLTCRAAEVYTPTIMRLFHYEREKAMEYLITHVSTHLNVEEETWRVYKLNEVQVEIDTREVRYCASQNSLRCTCSSFETMWILCRHIIQFMVIRGSTGALALRTLPSQYMKQRWCRNVRGTYQGNHASEFGNMTVPNSYVGRYQRLTATTVTLASLASYDTNLYEVVIEEVLRLIELSKTTLSNTSIHSGNQFGGEQHLHLNRWIHSQLVDALV